MNKLALSIFLLSAIVYETISYQICKADLLYSYGVQSPRYINHASLMCGGEEPESCCSLNDETRLTKEWKNTNQMRIKPYMSAYILLMKKIFNYYEDLIVLAKYIYINPESSTECKDAAEQLVMDYVYREEVVKFIDRLNILLNNMASMRKGFYCSLCSVYNQRFFDTQTKKIIFSNDFCENLVEFSISEIHYKAKKILPVFSKMNTIINCKDKVDSPEEVSIEFESEDVGKVDKCFDSYSEHKEPLLFLSDCVDYCKKFSLSSASDIFEGSLSKLLYLYNKISASGLIANDLIFPDLSMKSDYSFEKLNAEFFENKLSFEDLAKYETTFEPSGLEPFTQSTNSRYHYQLNKDPLKFIKIAGSENIVKMLIIGLVVYLFK